MNGRVAPLPVRTYLSIENRLLRESLGRLLRKRTEFSVASQTSTADELATDLAEGNFDVLLGDSFLLGKFPGWFKEEGGGAPRAKVILIGMEQKEEQFLQAVRFGVGGYLLQDASASDIIAPVRAVFRGEAVCPPRLCATLFKFVAQLRKEPVPNTSSRPDLTLRQQQLVNLVAKGLTNKEIAWLC